MVCNSEHVPMEVASLCQGWFKAVGVLVSPEHSLLSVWWQQSLTVAIPVHTLGMSRRHGLNRTDHPMYSIYNIQLFDLLTLNKTTINWIKDQFDDVLNFNKSTFTQSLYFIFESLTTPDRSELVREWHLISQSSYPVAPHFSIIFMPSFQFS